MFSLIACVDANMGIARKGKIPWNSPEDMKNFQRLTSNNVVIMGRKTWDSLPDRSRPLPNRINIVISKKSVMKMGNIGLYPNLVLDSVNSCVEHFNLPQNKKIYKGKKLFVIGGETIYSQFLNSDLIGEIHLTCINKNFGCDQFLYLPQVNCAHERQLAPNVAYKWCYTINNEENQFLQLMSDVINHGNRRMDRTGTGTLSIFSRELRFDLSRGKIPMMTTRPISLRYVFEELMWILRGQTDNKILNDKKIHIWDDNTTRKFLYDRGLGHLPEGDIGPSYGFQMRHFGAHYDNCKKTYDGQGVDQLANVIHLLKTDPTNRRIIMNLWNPGQLDQMALPPCLYGYQFYVSNNYLSCKLIQRSSDIALAGSHNCTAGALLVRMLCVVTGLMPGEVIWSPSDIHVYLNQIDAVKEQIKRIPTPFPVLNITEFPLYNNILNFEFNQLKLLNYTPQPKIQFAMNA